MEQGQNEAKPGFLQAFDALEDPRSRAALSPLDIVQHFVQRWQLEVTFEEVRRHLAVETQRQCSPLDIARTTPVRLALYSLVTLLATRLVRAG